ncbi:hypothetical protein KR032_007866, partial [Drosophila birchii]
YRLSLVLELLYGVALLTAITAAREILLTLRLSNELESSVSFSYPDIWFTMIRSLSLTALAMLPTVKRLQNCLTRRRLLNVLVMAPWILVCCLKFYNHIFRHIFAIGHVDKINDSVTLIMGVVTYCVLFGLAAEMFWHW